MTLITFSLNGGLYAIDVCHVKEVIPLPEITPMAKLPSFFCGVINLRGFVLPVIDLRKRLELERKVYELSEDIIVIKQVDQTMGLIVDKVLSVIDVQESQLLPAPKMHDDIDISHLLGMVQSDVGLVMRLDLATITRKVSDQVEVIDLSASELP